MSLLEETRMLRKELAAWAADPEWELLRRYDLLRNKPPDKFADRCYRRGKNMLADLGMVSPHITKYPWLPTLKHARPSVDQEILLIWALGVERDDLRVACQGFIRRLDGVGMVPVLVTDVADFASFSRLQWLVEYVPDLSGEGESYRSRKQHYLAWRYRDAVVVPACAGNADDSEWNEVMEMK